MDLSVLLRTAHEQVVTVVMSYRALPPVQDYLVIADETTLVYAGNALRDHERVLVPAADHGSYDTAALGSPECRFLRLSSHRKRAGLQCPFRAPRDGRITGGSGRARPPGDLAGQQRSIEGASTSHSQPRLVELVNVETRTRSADHGAGGGRAIFPFSS
jgi:hypothetical protein